MDSLNEVPVMAPLMREDHLESVSVIDPSRHPIPKVSFSATERFYRTCLHSFVNVVAEIPRTLLAKEIPRQVNFIPEIIVVAHNSSLRVD